jgi:cytochrome c-type biogenesis protein CcmH/NrfF
MVGGFLWVLWFLPALKLVAMILLKVALKHQKFKKNQSRKSFGFSSF